MFFFEKSGGSSMIATKASIEVDFSPSKVNIFCSFVDFVAFSIFDAIGFYCFTDELGAVSDIQACDKRF